MTTSGKLVSTIYRTVPVERSLRRQMAACRGKSGKTTAEFLQDAIGRHLEDIRRELLAAGLASVTKSARPTRLPLDAKLLTALRAAAVATGVPASRLLSACINRSCQRTTCSQAGTIAEGASE